MTKLPYPLLNVAQATFLVTWSVLWASIGLLGLAVTRDPGVPLGLARRFWARGLLRVAFTELRVAPLPDADWSQPHIFVMNHQSMLDVPCAFVALPALLRFVAKHSLQHVPFLGWFMRATGMVFVNRGDPVRSIQSMSRAAAQIRGGISILSFPEGTRSKTGEVLAFKKGTFMLALESGVPVVPVSIDGTGRLLPSGGFKLRPGVVHLRVGAPIPTAGRRGEDRDALMREVRDAVIALKSREAF